MRREEGLVSGIPYILIMINYLLVNIALFVLRWMRGRKVIHSKTIANWDMAHERYRPNSKD